MPLLLTDSDVNQVMTMQDCVGVMEDMLDQAQRGKVWFQPRTHIRTPVGYHHIMPGAVLDRNKNAPFGDVLSERLEFLRSQRCKELVSSVSVLGSHLGL